MVGFETGDPQVLKNIHKGVTLDLGRRLANGADWVSRFTGMFMGLPGETKASIEASIRFACEWTRTPSRSLSPPLIRHQFYDFCREAGLPCRMTPWSTAPTASSSASSITPGPRRHLQRCPNSTAGFFRPRYMASALVMIRDPVERRLLKEEPPVSELHVQRRQGQQPRGRGQTLSMTGKELLGLMLQGGRGLPIPSPTPAMPLPFCSFPRVGPGEQVMADPLPTFPGLEFSDKGVGYLCFTGGEPLLYPALLPALGRARDLGVHTLLCTNGWRLTPAYIRELKAAA